MGLLPLRELIGVTLAGRGVLEVTLTSRLKEVTDYRAASTQHSDVRKLSEWPVRR